MFSKLGQSKVAVIVELQKAHSSTRTGEISTINRAADPMAVQLNGINRDTHCRHGFTGTRGCDTSGHVGLYAGGVAQLPWLRKIAPAWQKAGLQAIIPADDRSRESTAAKDKDSMTFYGDLSRVIGAYCPSPLSIHSFTSLLRSPHPSQQVGPADQILNTYNFLKYCRAKQ